jgi:putative transcriptional regulator
LNAPGYLTNQLLIALPALGDENFSHTVTLICDHSESGALGLILNKPLQMQMGEIFRQLQIDVAAGSVARLPVLRGGPVQADRGFVVHRAGGQWESTLRVSEAIHVTTSRDVLRAIARGEGPQDAFLVLGYAGWESGQLEDEIRANAWITAPADAKLVFEVPFERRWNAAGELLGVELSRISPVSGNA